MDVGGTNRRAGNGSRQARRKSPSASLAANSRRNGRRSVNGDADNFQFTFPSDYDKGHDVQKAIMESAEKRGFSNENFFALRMALEEGLVNAIKHGNGLDPRKLVHVEARVSARRAEITIEDQGSGFDRKCVPDPTADENLHKCSGRGILLIEKFMSEVKWDRGGRRLRMVRENLT